MNLMKSMIIVIILVGIGLIITAFIAPPLQMQIAAALIGLGFICLGLMTLKRNQDKKRDEERYEQLITKLDQIQQELEKIEEPKGKGVAIADVIASGLKYYTEHMSKPKEEKPDD